MNIRWMYCIVYCITRKRESWSISFFCVIILVFIMNNSLENLSLWQMWCFLIQNWWPKDSQICEYTAIHNNENLIYSYVCHECLCLNIEQSLNLYKTVYLFNSDTRMFSTSSQLKSIHSHLPLWYTLSCLSPNLMQKLANIQTK